MCIHKADICIQCSKVLKLKEENELLRREIELLFRQLNQLDPTRLQSVLRRFAQKGVEGARGL